MEAARVPHEGLGRLFLRFLRFGLLAWGGPVAQIALIRQELVDEERWIPPERFHRTLAVYQALPGPEAHELCVYFGMIARGRLGGLLAGLGFMLPGFLLMLALSALYVRFGLQNLWVQAAFGTVQAAVAALIVRAVFRIGSHALKDGWAWAICAVALLSQLGRVPFLATLAVAGVTYVLVARSRAAGAVLLAVWGAVAGWLLWQNGFSFGAGGAAAAAVASGEANRAGLWELLVSGLRAGLLTFGGAYTAIPLLQGDAVEHGRWMTNAQFLDGLALGGVLPAPLIIFSTFVGYLGGGLAGALVMTAAVFLPAFSFTLVGHAFFERLVHGARVHRLLDGITAGVVGLIAATSLELMPAALSSKLALAVFAVALVVLFRSRARLVIPVVVAGAAVCGLAMRALA